MSQLAWCVMVGYLAMTKPMKLMIVAILARPG